MTETAEKKTDDLQAGREMERARTATTMARPGGASLITEGGRTQISDGVVAKIAGLAARSIPGVHSMGTGMARRRGQIRSLVPGSSGPSASANQGVAVEVGERQAAIDLDIVTWYGQNIVDVSDAVRRAVAGQVEGMTGLEVVEVNISVDDIFVEAEGDEQVQRVK
jgi:uncharacterized alkaline shock family protein YloU